MRLRLSILLLESAVAGVSPPAVSAPDSETAPPPIAVSVGVIKPTTRDRKYSASLQPNREVAVAFRLRQDHQASARR